MKKFKFISKTTHRSMLLLFAVIVIFSVGLIMQIFKNKSADGIIVVSGGETIVAGDIDINNLKKSTTVEAAKKIYYYYKFAEEDEKMAARWYKELQRRQDVVK